MREPGSRANKVRRELFGAEAPNRLFFVLVRRDQTADARHIEHFFHIGRGIQQFETTLIAHEVRVTAHQLSEAGAIDPGDAAQIDNYARVRLLEDLTP